MLNLGTSFAMRFTDWHGESTVWLLLRRGFFAASSFGVGATHVATKESNSVGKIEELLRHEPLCGKSHGEGPLPVVMDIMGGDRHAAI